jgi:CHAD domain-containing protein
MNTGNLVWLNWKKEQQEFEKNLSVLRKNHRKDALHDLRVAVKKLRAYLELGLVLYQDRKASPTDQVESLLKNTESLFTISGRQRDLDICLKVVSSLKKETGHPYKELQSYFRSCLSKSRRWTMAGIQQFKIIELQKAGRLLEQKKQPEDPITTPSGIMKLISGQIPELPHCFRKPHQLRKKLKTIYYWLQLVRPEAPETTSLHDILDDLGNWQDLGITGTRLKHFRQDLLPGVFDEKMHVREAEKEIETRQKILLRSAIAKTRKWLKSMKD